MSAARHGHSACVRCGVETTPGEGDTCRECRGALVIDAHDDGEASS